MSEEKSKLKPEELQAFCDAVKRIIEGKALSPRDYFIADDMLPKIRAIAVPAAVPVKSTASIWDEFAEIRDAIRPAEFAAAKEPSVPVSELRAFIACLRDRALCDQCGCAENLEDLIEKHSKDKP